VYTKSRTQSKNQYLLNALQLLEEIFTYRNMTQANRMNNKLTIQIQAMHLTEFGSIFQYLFFVNSSFCVFQIHVFLIFPMKD